MPSVHMGYVSVAEISAAYRISASNVYRIASESQWRKYRLARKVRYRWEDVEETLATRRCALATAGENG